MLISLTNDRKIIAETEFIPLDDQEAFTPHTKAGIGKYQADLGHDATLDALFVNQQSETLIVSCHGALPRKTTDLPRFERLRTFLGTSFSSIYFGDPTLHLSEQLGLTWYTGWRSLDLYHVLAQWVRKAAAATAATRIIFVGSSGGGFASLQISALIPNSMAIPLNPQTAIWKYQPKGSLGYARNYIKNVMPHLTPEGGVKNVSADMNWSEPLGERASALIRYSQPVQNFVFYAQNLNDISHVSDHYWPFRAAAARGPNRNRIRFFTYEGQHRHTSPQQNVFEEIMTTAISWLDTELNALNNQPHSGQ